MCRSIKSRLVVNQTTNPKTKQDNNYYNRQVYPNHVNIAYRNGYSTPEGERNGRIGNPDRNEVFYSKEEKDRNSMSLRLFMVEKKFDSMMNNMNVMEKKLDSIINNLNYK